MSKERVEHYQIDNFSDAIFMSNRSKSLRLPTGSRTFQSNPLFMKLNFHGLYLVVSILFEASTFCILDKIQPGNEYIYLSIL